MPCSVDNQQHGTQSQQGGTATCNTNVQAPTLGPQALWMPQWHPAPGKAAGQSTSMSLWRTVQVALPVRNALTDAVPVVHALAQYGGTKHETHHCDTGRAAEQEWHAKTPCVCACNAGCQGQAVHDRSVEAVLHCPCMPGSGSASPRSAPPPHAQCPPQGAQQRLDPAAGATPTHCTDMLNVSRMQLNMSKHIHTHGYWGPDPQPYLPHKRVMRWCRSLLLGLMLQQVRSLHVRALKCTKEKLPLRGPARQGLC
jgi:hypothetical protein